MEMTGSKKKKQQKKNSAPQGQERHSNEERNTIENLTPARVVPTCGSLCADSFKRGTVGEVGTADRQTY